MYVFLACLLAGTISATGAYVFGWWFLFPGALIGLLLGIISAELDIRHK